MRHCLSTLSCQATLFPFCLTTRLLLSSCGLRPVFCLHPVLPHNTVSISSNHTLPYHMSLSPSCLTNNTACSPCLTKQSVSILSYLSTLSPFCLATQHCVSPVLRYDADSNLFHHIPQSLSLLITKHCLSPFCLSTHYCLSAPCLTPPPSPPPALSVFGLLHKAILSVPILHYHSTLLHPVKAILSVFILHYHSTLLHPVKVILSVPILHYHSTLLHPVLPLNTVSVPSTASLA